MLILQKHCSTRCLSTKFCEIIYTEPIIVASFLTPGLPNKQEVLAAAWGGPATQFCAEPCANPRRSPQQFHLRKIVCLCGAATGRTCGHTHNTQTPHHIYTTYILTPNFQAILSPSPTFPWEPQSVLYVCESISVLCVVACILSHFSHV